MQYQTVQTLFPWQQRFHRGKTATTSDENKQQVHCWSSVCYLSSGNRSGVVVMWFAVSCFRLLVGNKLNIHMSTPEVTVSIIKWDNLEKTCDCGMWFIFINVVKNKQKPFSTIPWHRKLRCILIDSLYYFTSTNDNVGEILNCKKVSLHYIL